MVRTGGLCRALPQHRHIQRCCIQTIPAPRPQSGLEQGQGWLVQRLGGSAAQQRAWLVCCRVPIERRHTEFATASDMERDINATNAVPF